MSKVAELEKALEEARKEEQEATKKAVANEKEKEIGRCFVKSRTSNGSHSILLTRIEKYDADESEFKISRVSACHTQPAKYGAGYKYFQGASFQINEGAYQAHRLYELGDEITPETFARFFELCREVSQARVKEIRDALKIVDKEEKIPFPNLGFKPEDFPIDLPHVTLPEDAYFINSSPFLIGDKYLISKNSLLMAKAYIEKEKASIRFCGSDCFDTSRSAAMRRGNSLNKIIALFRPHMKEMGIGIKDIS